MERGKEMEFILNLSFSPGLTAFPLVFHQKLVLIFL